MNKVKISIVLGIMCLALTAGICVQIKTVENSNTTVSQNYKENSLRAQVLEYKEKYENKYKELEKAETELEKVRETATKDDSELEEAENQIKLANKINGFTEVTGPGVIITLEDGQYTAGTTVNVSDIIVHDLDVLSVINELRNAGAEAISINEQRVINTTSISCGGNIIDINGEKVGAPFEIKAIGLPEQLSALNRPYGYLDILKEYGVQATLKKSNSITIPKYTGVVSFKYLENVK